MPATQVSTPEGEAAAETPAPSSEQSELGAGSVLGGRYRITRELGRGGMSIVYEATSLKLGRRFAVKVPRCERPITKEAQRRLEREISVGSTLESSHIARVLDCDTADDGTPVIVMEYVPGRDLRRVLKSGGRMPLRRAVNLLLQACRGLAVAHAHGVVHRDLKPSNLAITPELGGHEHCTILDFGVAKWLAGSAHETESTRTGALVGTLAYMPPEQIRGQKDLDARADVYALGAILYECLSGERPFEAESQHALMYRILHERPPSLASLRPDLSGEVVALVMRALAADREQRFASVEELAAALEGLGPGPAARRGPDDVTLPADSGVQAGSGAETASRAGLRRFVAPALALAATVVLVNFQRIRASEPEPVEARARAAPPAVTPAERLEHAPVPRLAASSTPVAPAEVLAASAPVAVVALASPAAPARPTRSRDERAAVRPSQPAASAPVPPAVAPKPDPLETRGYVVKSPYGPSDETASIK